MSRNGCHPPKRFLSLGRCRVASLAFPGLKLPGKDLMIWTCHKIPKPADPQRLLWTCHNSKTSRISPKTVLLNMVLPGLHSFCSGCKKVKPETRDRSQVAKPPFEQNGRHSIGRRIPVPQNWLATCKWVPGVDFERVAGIGFQLL